MDLETLAPNLGKIQIQNCLSPIPSRSGILCSRVEFMSRHGYVNFILTHLIKQVRPINSNPLISCQIRKSYIKLLALNVSCWIRVVLRHDYKTI
jgi:hypothetical protein